MLKLLNIVLSCILAVYVCFAFVGGIINFVWLILHFIFPKRIKHDIGKNIDFDNEDGNFDGWSH